MAAPRFPAPGQRGFSLIELMVALLLGLLLMSGIVAVYLESKRGWAQDDAIARVQENGRYALRLLSREIAMAGFYGGVTETDAISSPAIADCKTWLLNPDEVIETYNHADTDAPAEFSDCFDADEVATGSDILALRRASDRPLIDDGEWETGFSALTGTQYYLNTNNDGLGTSEIELGSALDTSALVAASSKADVWEYHGSIYYIGTENGVPSLCVRSAQNTAQTCLVNGIENLQVELGVDTDGDAVPDEFISDQVAPGEVDADTVLAMRIHLLVRSIEPVRSSPTDSRTWNLGDESVDTNASADDQFYRRVFSATVPRNNQVFTTFE
ncbi:MAG TPA: PilW family protein [Porticoccaceae bacterium]|nr:PilW family protein [Porticoccaceae bacterium]